MLKRRYKILLNYVIGPLLFIILALSIYTRVKKQYNAQQIDNMLDQAFSRQNRLFFVALVILMGINWALEARKWQLLVKTIQQVSFFTAVKAVLSGLSFTLFLPNGIGEYFGRIVYMKEGNRLRSISVTIVGSIAQILVTLACGLLGLTYLTQHSWQNALHTQSFTNFWITGAGYVLSLATGVIIFIYFNLSFLTTLVEKIPFVYKYKYLVESVEQFHWKQLTIILFLSFTRYAVFMLQYLLMLHIFNVQIGWFDVVCTTSVLFLVLAILPTIPVADLGIRGETGLQLFGFLTKNAGGIIFTTAGIWFLNIIIPSIAGSLFVLSIKLFRNR